MNEPRSVRQPPEAPRPDLIRRPRGAFGWLEARLLREGYLSRLGPEGSAVLVFLALAADRRGVSYYGRDRMGRLLGMTREAIDRALARLEDLGLVAHRPWGPNQLEGVWQILPVPTGSTERPHGVRDAIAIGEIFRQLAPDTPQTRPPELRAFT